MFVSGSPGATQRLLTQDQLATVRDVVLPMDQLIASELRGRLIRFSEESEENAFIAMDPIVGLENTYKRGLGRMRALTDAGFLSTRSRWRSSTSRQQRRRHRDPFDELTAVQPALRELYPAMALLEGGTGVGTTSVAGGSQLFAWARTIVRGAQERAKPSAERLPEFGDARLSSVQSALFAERPTYPALEQVRMEWWLSKTREWLTADNPAVRGLLGKESPEQLSARLVEGSTLADPAVRRALWEGGLAAVEASDDPMIQYLLSIQDETRAIRADWETRVQVPDRSGVRALGRSSLRGLRRRCLSRCHGDIAPDLRPDRRARTCRASGGGPSPPLQASGTGRQERHPSTSRPSFWPPRTGSIRTRC